MSVAFFDGDLPPELSLKLRAQPSVAVDTETSGLDWSADQLLLCQLFSPATGPVLLRNVSGVPGELAALIADPKVVKVLHHAPFDLRFLEARWGIRAGSVACTKAASKLLNPSGAHEEHSLKSVLDRYLGVKLEKGAVRTSDWSTPVLSDEQVEYATGDVSHLLELHRAMSAALEAKSLTEIYAQVCAYMPIDAHLEVTGVPNPLVY
ncbi:ribonuclease D [Oryzihumus leptocrescens]|uniref:Ribonuclease D n=1 Tax=Oryzihumus leptocrescens TaxID=297536 RepID=A0A542ZET8_9MICO|nr:ribonuclease D [Oryzihumus leptocrescens]